MAAKKKRGVGGVRPGAGRKAIPPRERLRNHVQFSLRDEEYERLLKAADDEQLATFVRGIVLRYLRRRK